MSFFEAGMLICFGLSWPISIYKSWKTRRVGSKSVIFLFFVLLGYGAGVAHKFLYSRDIVIVFYVLNALMVLIDILLYYRNRYLAIKEELQ